MKLFWTNRINKEVSPTETVTSLPGVQKMFRFSSCEPPCDVSHTWKGPCIPVWTRITRTSARMLQLFQSSWAKEFDNEVWTSMRLQKHGKPLHVSPTISWKAHCDWLHYWQCVVKTNINLLGPNSNDHLVRGSKIAWRIFAALSAFSSLLLDHLLTEWVMALCAPKATCHCRCSSVWLMLNTEVERWIACTTCEAAFCCRKRVTCTL